MVMDFSSALFNVERDKAKEIFSHVFVNGLLTKSLCE